MGNSGSQPTPNTTQRTTPVEEETQWAQSFPKTPYQHKLVVPDRDAHQRLRPTGNGEILHSGGTISGRNQQWQGVSRSSSIPAVKQRSPQQRSKPSHRNNYSRALTPSYRKDQIKRFGSEPDLRGASKPNQEYQDRYKGRKKYKAPPPPAVGAIDKNNDFEDTCGIEAGSPIRRARLFKTRAETKKKISSPVNNRRLISSVSEFTNLDKQYKPADETFGNEGKFKKSTSSNSSTNNNTSNNKVQQKTNRQSIPQLQRTRSSPEFQAELKEVTKRLINIKTENKVKDTAPTIESKLKTLDHNLNKKELIRNKLKDLKTKEIMILDEVRPPVSGKESTPEQSPPKVKTFYFGMEHDDLQKVPNSIGSDTSSESDTEQSGQDISLQLRPILPKKQLEIPRFSPAAAWKLLSAVDTNPACNLAVSEEGSVFIEDKIEKLSRPPPPYRLQIGPRSNHDKSGDSGISGDETPEAALPSPRQRGISWTPQQDLGDDSSLEEGSNPEYSNPVKFPSRPHVFSLSLPRENHLAAYISEKSLQPYSSLQKLKRSMSGVLGTLGKKEYEVDQDPSENWFLSRSAPNSLNNGFNSLELRRQQKQTDDFDLPGPLTQTNTRRIIYLPQSNLTVNGKKKHISKSYENISTESNHLPENLQDPPKSEQAKWSNKKPKKFTFQSTVRQIERRRLAEKLSKEAERKEQQRLRELEAMQRVEEEFQKKRAREKASIRQQLRLYSMDDSAWSSLPPNLEITEEVRQEPDGAVSSSTSSPTFTKSSESKEGKAQSTQILSEFRQTHREYKEFRTGTRYTSEQTTTVHPRVTYNMPKATGSSCLGNYRKDFAHGIKSGESSHSEESIPTKNNSPLVIASKR